MRFFRICLFLIVLISLPAAASAETLKVLLLPFETRAEGDVSALRRNMTDSFAAAVEAQGVEVVGISEIRELMTKGSVRVFDEKTALELSSKVQADFAVLGSITKIGAAITVDWRLLDGRDGVVKAFFHDSSTSIADLLSRVNEKAAQTVVKMREALGARPAVKEGAVTAITVIGNQRVDTEAVMRRVSSRAGEPFSPDAVREDIRSIYSTGYFDDVAADLSDTASGKVLTFKVREMPFMRKIEYRGHDEIKIERLEETVTMKTNTVLDRVLLAANAEKLKGLYEDEGFYLAKIDTAVETDGVEATVVFKIEEGPEVRVKRITIIGNDAFSDKKLKGLMTTNEAGALSAVTQSGKFNEYVFQNDLAVLMSHYFDNGYINADVLDSRVLLSEDRRAFLVTIAITEGEQFRTGKIDVTGDLLYPREELVSKLKLSPGKVFSRSALSRGLEAISIAYGDKGYAYAEIRPQTKVNPVDRTIDITIDIKQNELVYVERIDLSGNVRTRDKVIRREVEVDEGGLYSATELKKSRDNLRRLGFFEDVRITETRGSASDRVKLIVSVKERPTGSISLGFGYSSVDKLIGTASIAQSNFMGTGLKLDLSGTVSASSSRYILGVTEPWLFDRPISAGFDIYNTEKQYPDFDIRKKGFDVRFGFPITKRYTRGNITYKLEDAYISNVDAAASTYIKEQEGSSTESSIRAQVRRDTRNDAFFPSEGSTVSATYEFAGGPLGGTSYFIKYEFEGVKFFAMPWDTVFSIHGNIGYVHGYDGHEVPIYERYFLGGISSLRGFETRSVGPRDLATGDLIGGNTMFIVNAEYLFPVFPEQSIKGVVFFDIGNAYQGRIDFSDVRTSAGAGVRWFSPLGPLRLELGFNLDPRTGESSSQWEFAIGSVF
ncbi:MAG: outer membrane protein assembly factor BamA [Deltaproteobacteria bacterium]|nr:outer membrane protein assembly factor BamA [Deltaproteobacteria bacterium]